MNTYNEVWRDWFDDAIAGGHKACVMRPDGYILAIATENYAAKEIASNYAVTGFRWQEFIEPDDLPRFLVWLKDADAEPITYRRLAAVDGDVGMCWVTAAKRHFRGVVLICGALSLQDAPHALAALRAL